jgi:mono/diheme cytochrome c family protein
MVHMKLRFAAIALIPFAATLMLRPSLRAQDTSKSVWDGIYTQAQADRGKQLYSDACASCHGPELTGGEMAPPLVGGDFQSDWNGLSVGDLFERMRISMPQNAPGSLSAAQNADVLAFVLAQNKFPAGTAEMPKEAMILKSIKFESKKSGQ